MMFKANTPLYLRDVTFKTENVDGETRKVVMLSWNSQPFTKEMAQDLEIARHLFNSDTSEPLSDVVTTQLAIAKPLMQLTMKMAPDATPRFIIPDVEVSKTISIRKDKEGPVFSATFSANFRYPDAETLLYLANSVNSQQFVTFDVQQGALGLGGAQAGPDKVRPGVSPMFDDKGAAAGA